MNVIKLAVISFICLFLLVTGISLFIPSTIRISRAVNMQANTDSIYTMIAVLQNWRHWHPALQALPASEFVMKEDGSLQVKNNNLKIIQRKKDEVITQLKEQNGRPVISTIRLISHKQTDSLTVQWYMEFRLRWYPWEKFRSLFYENIYGLQMEQGLQQLKELFQSAAGQ